MPSSEPSKAYMIHAKTLDRALDLLELRVHISQLHTSKQISLPSRAPLNDITRSTVVLGVAAMDAYFTNRFVEEFVPFLKRARRSRNGIKDNLIAFMQEAGLTTTTLLSLIDMQRPHSRIRSLVQRHLDNYTTQNFKRIDELYLLYGLSDLTKHAEAKSGRLTLRSSVRKLVERRHQIVHTGDLDRHKRLRPIDANRFLGRLKDQWTFVNCCEDIITSAMR